MSESTKVGPAPGNEMPMCLLGQQSFCLPLLMLIFGPVGHLGFMFFLVNNSLCVVFPLLEGGKANAICTALQLLAGNCQ